MNVVIRLATGLAVAGLMAVAMWLYTVKPHLDGAMQNPIPGHGHVGAVAGNRAFSVRVDRVDVATAIDKQDIFKKATIPSPGLFVIVHLKIKSNEKPFQPGHVRLVTRGGVSYDETGRPDVHGQATTYEPMLWGPASYVFEIPKERLAGAHFVIGGSDLMNQLSAETDVDLGIGDAKAARMIAHASRDYVLQKP